MGKVLGLDIGISSVGWGVIENETGKIIDAGVRLFEEAERNANEERRDFRGSRRLSRRRSHRLQRAKQLFKEYGFPLSGIGKFDPYNTRYNAIYDTVSKEELVVALYHLVKMRGTTLDSPEDEEKDNNNELSTKQQIAKNRKLLKDQYICEVQLKRRENGEKIRGSHNRFRTSDYLNEATAILNKQREFHPEIDESFIESLLTLIKTRREYYEGPGSKKSPTPYGRFFINEHGEIEEVSMINKMRGKCTYFPEELRISKMSVTADIFNLLSGDLNKIQLDGEYLTYEDKLYLFNNFIKNGKNITLKQILKYKGLSDDTDVRGYRVNIKTDKPEFTKFEGFKEIRKIVLNNDFPQQILDDIDLMDDIAEILTAEKGYHRREEQLHELFNEFEPAIRGKMVNAFKESTAFSGYHSLSKKAMNLIMEDLWRTNKNQMELFSELGLEEKRLSKMNKTFNIPFDDTAILSTVAKRAHREAIKIVNAVRKKYGELDSIVVETAREKNSEDKREQERDFQRQIGKFEKEMAELLGVKSLAELKLTGKQHLALKLLKQQNWQSIYSGKSITAQDVVLNRHIFEIDHIIPVSISFDDSQANKVVCLHGENQDKGQATPYQYFQTQKRPRSFEEFKAHVLSLYQGGSINRKKKDYLLEMRDVQYNEELQKEFINRNLVDTQYAMRSFSMNLRSFFKVNNIDTKVLSIRGSFTSALRRRARMNKDREESHAHHAIDALIVAAIGKMSIFDFFSTFDMNEAGAVVNRDTGEILTEEEMFDNKLISFLRGLRNYEPNIKYSHKVDRKPNRTLSNQTIYATREKDGEKYTIGKYKDLYNLDRQQAAALIKKLKSKPEDFFIAKHNPDVMETVLKIIDEYKNEANPFAAYYEEHGYILKDGKIPVKTLKYYDQRLGVHLNISHKYSGTKHEVVLRSIKGIRVDFYRNAEGKYKYLGVPYHWFKQEGNRYVLDMKKYNEEKMKDYKIIDDTYQFQFSLYKNDLFSYDKGGEDHFRIFRGDKSPRQNQLEVDYVWKNKENRTEGILTPSTISNVIKYNVDILGNTFKVDKENFKNYLQI
ncbi:type II CRISPR RNA-guided endonuclease Cas9 [Bacillaceae bacterium W0354]